MNDQKQRIEYDLRITLSVILFIVTYAITLKLTENNWSDYIPHVSYSCFMRDSLFR